MVLMAVLGRLPLPAMAAIGAVVVFAQDIVGPLAGRLPPYVSVPPDERWSLALLYVVFVVAVAVLSFPADGSRI